MLITYREYLLDNYEEILRILQETAKNYLSKMTDNANFMHVNPNEFTHNNTNLNNWFCKNNLEPEHAAIVRIKPNNDSLPHIDSYATKYVLIFPVQNCESTYTEFYHLPETEKPLRFVDHLGYEYFRVPFGLEVIGRYSVRNPVLINSRTPHKIYNRTDNDRVVVTFMFREDPENIDFTP